MLKIKIKCEQCERRKQKEKITGWSYYPSFCSCKGTGYTYLTMQEAILQGHVFDQKIEFGEDEEPKVFHGTIYADLAKYMTTVVEEIRSRVFHDSIVWEPIHRANTPFRVENRYRQTPGEDYNYANNHNRERLNRIRRLLNGTH